MERVLTIDDVQLDGRTVLVRVDINSPLDPESKIFLDHTRMKMILPPTSLKKKMLQSNKKKLRKFLQAFWLLVEVF